MNIFQAQLLLGDATLSEQARKDGWDSPIAPSEQKTTIAEFEAVMAKTGIEHFYHCPICEKDLSDSYDECDDCGEDFGLSGDDGGGAFNSRCVHCNATEYSVLCPECRSPLEYLQ